jgi:hypothetical protein
MNDGKKTHHIATVIPKVVRRLTKTLNAAAVADVPHRAAARQKIGLGNWMTYETQAKVMALAAESGRDVKEVLRLAVAVYSATLHGGAKRIATRDGRTP